MLLCNLAVLMAERGLKIVDVYNKTGISKTTLMALSENKGKGIQFDTINKLCNFLQVTPSEFFVYSPYIFETKKIDGPKEDGNLIVLSKNGIKVTEYEAFQIDSFEGNDFVTIWSDDFSLEKIFNKLPKMLQTEFIAMMRKAIADIYDIKEDYELFIGNTLVDKN